MWLLNYLLDNVGRVFSLVTYYYDRLIDAARNALGWAISEASKAYWRAISFAQNVLALAKNYATTIFNTLAAFVVGIDQRIRALIVATVDFIRVLINLAVAAARNFLLANLYIVEAALIALINGVTAGLDATFRALIDTALGGITYVRELRQDILDVLALLNKQNRGKLADFFANGFRVLNLIVTNPGGFVLSFLRAFILPMLEWSLAYSLGSVVAALPPWPDFLKDGFGDLPAPPGPPPELILGLVAPLSSLRISGNRYGGGHPGLDLGCATNTPISTMHDGRVEESGFSAVGYGWNVTVRGGQFWTRYAHLVSEGLPRGTAVNAGNVIGLCGSSGNSTGSHLHLEIKQNGIFINPAPILGL